MALHTDLAAFRANTFTSSRTTVFIGVKSTTTNRQASSSRTVSTFTSFPTSAGNPNPKVATRWIVIGVVVGFTVVVICLLLLCCCRNISKKPKKKVPQLVVFVPLGRRSNLARNQQLAMYNLDMYPNTPSRGISPLRPLDPPRSPLGEASGDKAIKLHELSKDHLEAADEDSDADSNADYWKAYKERELKRRGSPETEKIRKAIERARVQDHVEWAVYRRSLSESSRLAPTEEHIRPE